MERRHIIKATFSLATFSLATFKKATFGLATFGLATFSLATLCGCSNPRLEPNKGYEILENFVPVFFVLYGYQTRDRSLSSIVLGFRRSTYFC
jgi:hypothetical protein